MRLIELTRSALILVVSPVAGFTTLGYLLVTNQFAPWHAGLVLGLVFGPAIALDKVSALGSRLERIGHALAEDDAREET